MHAHLQVVDKAAGEVQAVPDLGIWPEQTLVCHIFACCFQVSLKKVQGCTLLLQNLLDSWNNMLGFDLISLCEQGVRQQRVAAGADSGLGSAGAVAAVCCCLHTYQATCEQKHDTFTA